MSTWLDSARARIQHIHEGLPADATLKQRKAALRAQAWKHHGGTSWGKKTWAIAAREYLERHGLPPKRPTGQSPNNRLHQAVKSGDIVFPFRGG